MAYRDRWRERGSALAQRRQEAYQRLEDIDARRLLLAGWGITTIAGRAATSPWLVHRWLEEVVHPADGDSATADPMHPPEQPPAGRD